MADNKSKQAENAAEARPGYDHSRDVDQRTNPSEEIKNIKDVETYDASEGQSETIHYNANSEKGFPRDVNIQGGSTGVSFAYEDRGAEVKSSVEEEE